MAGSLFHSQPQIAYRQLRHANTLGGMPLRARQGACKHSGKKGIMMSVRMKIENIPEIAPVADWFLKKHYAHRIPCITDIWGIFHHGILMGICSFGIPASRNLCTGIAGEENADIVLELNRLIIDDEARQIQSNVASYFVGACLRYLRNIKAKNKGLIVVSYADKAMGHSGKIYQATNFLYTGATKERTDIFSGDGKHSRHYEKKDDYSENRVLRSSKHRYVRILGNRRCVKELRNKLKYPVLPYPIEDTKRYDASYKPTSQTVLDF
jgi:hypothetical protein